MTLSLLPWLLGAGALGAVLRHLARVALPRPFGTAGANLVGALGAGVVAGMLEGPVALVLSVGLFGALTTYSTWMVEVVELGESGKGRWALLHLLGVTGVGVLLVLVALFAT